MDILKDGINFDLNAEPPSAQVEISIPINRSQVVWTLASTLRDGYSIAAEGVSTCDALSRFLEKRIADRTIIIEAFDCELEELEQAAKFVDEAFPKTDFPSGHEFGHFETRAVIDGRHVMAAFAAIAADRLYREIGRREVAAKIHWQLTGPAQDWGDLSDVRSELSNAEFEHLTALFPELFS